MDAIVTVLVSLLIVAVEIFFVLLIGAPDLLVRGLRRLIGRSPAAS
ncbi:MAG: hypothetical protein QOE06_475 [Thermoleophilaceae bacterium]|nr:hypothetical protein [Thermoleophilaceae bacterium]